MDWLREARWDGEHIHMPLRPWTVEMLYAYVHEAAHVALRHNDVKPGLIDGADVRHEVAAWQLALCWIAPAHQQRARALAAVCLRGYWVEALCNYGDDEISIQETTL